jgi:deoxyadenosine/deoxycytidine kinase
MDKNINDVFSEEDAELMKQFKAIDKLSESEVRICAKKAYSDLKEAHILYYEQEERKDVIIKGLHARILELETRIETRNKKMRELFDY